MTILVTGSAGFIGMHVVERLLARGEAVIGVDNLNDYYDVNLKRARLARLTALPGYFHHQLNIADKDAVLALFASAKPDVVVNLAAQAGVRYSLDNPYAYVESNLAGFTSILEGCRHHGVKHLVYASSSSVYGGNVSMPFSEHDNVDHPVSLYAATKKANELMAHTYSHLFGLPTTGLRFFTVYGPWGRPDMAYFSFTKAILAGQAIKVFNHGKMRRDFTYIDDIVEGVLRVVDAAPSEQVKFNREAMDPATSWAPWRVLNIGNHQPSELLDFIDILGQALGRSVEKEFLPMQPGDVVETFADSTLLASLTDFRPKTTLAEGIDKFVAWYKRYYSVS